MCGIAGVVALDERFRVTEQLVDTMRDALAHRGPDGARTWVDPDGRVGLGFRRLTVVDLSDEAMQPMENEDGTVRLVFNGEIYNHRDLRSELERLGHRFRTDHSDTESIVHAYEEWGIDCLHRLRGMFGLAIWDEQRRTLWLARDRMGVKPLFYSAYRGRLAFGSEIKAILADDERSRRVDSLALFHYLSFLTTPAPLTMFDGISKLGPGGLLEVRDGDVRASTWWDPWDHVTPQDAAPVELAERILAELRTSVRLRKMADVPVGVFLSGGIDSSTNAALFSEGERERVRTFTIGYDAEYPSYRNELGWAGRVAGWLGTDHHERIVSEDDVLAFLPRMVRQLDEPLADPVAVPIFFLSELARANGVRVAQAGEGADELFVGYPRWLSYLRLERLNALPVPLPAKRAALGVLAAAGQQAQWPYELLRRAVEQQPVFWGGAVGFTEARKRRLLGADVRHALAGATSWDAIAPLWQRFGEAAPERSHVHWMSYLDLRLRLPELLLARIDRMSMAVGLEVRVPFLDQELVRIALGIPQAAQLDGGGTKPLLRRAVSGVIPPDVLARPKQGFRMPVDEWFLARLGERARAEVRSFARESALLDEAECMRVLERPRRDAWYLLALALWWKELVA
ncbi:MAG TPA: asparagine synthase (glutamine-hydrolyzing) [Gaiellaceae bacterium]|nr:asparagine synthase (glutamine-hydrolyzing) [Gaiellaceae bacterium]